jgi:hypothetical protein
MDNWERLLINAWDGNPKKAKSPDNVVSSFNNSVVASAKSFDPRPDLKDDTILWSQLLMYAQDVDPSLEFYGILLGFRAMGTRLIIITDHKDPYFGECRMRGQFNKTGADHWASPGNYRAAAIKYLGPADNPNKYGRMLKEALSKLGLKKAA